MNLNGIWMLLAGIILGLPAAAIVTRWMSPIGAKTWGLIGGIVGGLIGLVIVEVLAGIDAPPALPVISSVDAFSAAVVSFFGVSAFGAAVGLLINWSIYLARHPNNNSLGEESAA
jgi:hypothetical protein